MRWLAIALTAAAVMFLVLHTSRVEAIDSFMLGEHDRIIAENPGCHAECRIQTPTLRVCTMTTFDCRAICMEVPECAGLGRKVPRVCAIVRTRP
ncbi:MAG TPA: hypothetical protein VFI16_06910 [Anaeromyxobacteraceae bacterium]|nr:hypothetical protein [Anaeromyxobacteraceae bacterium]